MKRFKLFLAVVWMALVAYAINLYFVAYMTEKGWDFSVIQPIGWVATVAFGLVYLIHAIGAIVGLVYLLFVEKIPKVKIVIER